METKASMTQAEIELLKAEVRVLAMENDQIENPLKYLEPSGVQERIIRAVGDFDGLGGAIVAEMPNKIGKTAIGTVIFGNIIFGPQNEFFDFGLFKEWRFEKQGRIAGNKVNVEPTGPLQTELKKWFPKGRYSAEKAGQIYLKDFKSDTGWTWDVMSFNQDATEFESKMLGFAHIDEPMPSHLLGAMLSRFSRGGILLFTLTPLEIGVVLDQLDELKSDKFRVITLQSRLEDSCYEHGLKNSRGRMPKIITHEEIEAYEAKIPREEREARIHGKRMHRSGRVLKAFDSGVHVYPENRMLPPDDGNNMMVMDPHDARFHFMIWVHFNRAGVYEVWNEWPTFEMEGAYFDKLGAMPANYDPETIAKIIKIQDCGREVGPRLVDARFNAGTSSDWSKKNNLMIEFARHKIDFRGGPWQTRGNLVRRINELLTYDRQQEISDKNRPKLMVYAHCKNVIRSLEKHYWHRTANTAGRADRPVQSEVEAEVYKDPVDCVGYAVLYHNGIFIEKNAKEEIKKTSTVKGGMEEYESLMLSCEM